MANGRIHIFLALCLTAVILSPCPTAAKNLGDACADKPDCGNDLYDCKEVCICIDSHVQVGSTCKAKMGTKCEKATDCVDNASCDPPAQTGGQADGDKKCTCKANFKDDGDGFCSKDLGAECATTKECGKPTMTCKAKKCACSEKYFQVDNKCKALVGTKCDKEADCVSNTDCAGDPGKKICKCAADMENHGDGLCSKDFGVACTDGSDECGPELMKCKESKCACKEGLVQEGKACRAGVESPCQITGQCVAYSECNKEGKCQCMDQYKKDGKICVQALNQICEKDADCTSAALKCADKKCVCSDGYSAKKDATTCTFNLGDTCDKNEDCGIQSLKCSEKICKCNDGYAEESNNCEYRLNKECTTDCGSPAMKCNAENKCKCTENAYKESEGLCKGVLGAPCFYGTDCYSPFAECLGNETISVCQCKEHYKLEGQKCMAAPGLACDTDNGCSDPHSNCTKNGDEGMFCTCFKDYKFNKETLKCAGSSISASLLIVGFALAPRWLW